MTTAEQNTQDGNKFIALIDGYRKDENSEIYIHETLPNMFLGEFIYHLDWNRLISVHNKARKLFMQLDKSIQAEFLKSDKTMIIRFGFVNFFSAFENQYSISPSWNKMVDFAKWYNKITK